MNKISNALYSAARWFFWTGVILAFTVLFTAIARDGDVPRLFVFSPAAPVVLCLVCWFFGRLTKENEH